VGKSPPYNCIFLEYQQIGISLFFFLSILISENSAKTAQSFKKGKKEAKKVPDTFFY